MNKFSPELLQQTITGLLQCSEKNSGDSISTSPPPSLVVGFSGGVDSLVLLHALSSLLPSPELSASKLPILVSSSVFNIKAIHVNHRLNPQADEWQSFCVSFCEKRQIPIQCVTVDAKPTQGEGPEAAARNARYDAFKKQLCSDDILLTGHHLDDQIETVFLQMLRGTGVDGAAGIRQISTLNASYLMRPLLFFSREMIESYAIENNLQWVNDPSNDETHYDRNYLRLEVLPVIQKRWPSYRQTISRFSQHMREASQLIKQIAEQDFLVACNVEKKSINIDKLNQLSLSRRNNLIRHWLSVEKQSIPSESQLSQIHTAIIAREDACPIVRWGETELRRFKNNLYVLNSTILLETKKTLISVKNWQVGQRVNVPGYGVLELKITKGDGIKASFFSSDNIQIKMREGGEKCKPKGRDKTQSLKKVFQEKNIAPWLRGTTPLVFIDDQIAAVVGEFYCQPFIATNDGLVIVRVSD